MNYDTQFTPTLRGATLGNGNLRGEFTKRGRLVNWRMWFELGTTSTVDGPITLTLPTPADGDMVWPLPYASAVLFDRSAQVHYVGHVTWSTTHIGVGVLNTSTGSTWLHSTSPTEPFTWSTGDSIRIDGMHLSADEVDE